MTHLWQLFAKDHFAWLSLDRSAAADGTLRSKKFGGKRTGRLGEAEVFATDRELSLRARVGKIGRTDEQNRRGEERNEK
jgi:hypothetical protein